MKPISETDFIQFIALLNYFVNREMRLSEGIPLLFEYRLGIE